MNTDKELKKLSSIIFFDPAFCSESDLVERWKINIEYLLTKDDKYEFFLSYVRRGISILEVHNKTLPKAIKELKKLIATVNKHGKVIIY